MLSLILIALSVVLELVPHLNALPIEPVIPVVAHNSIATNSASLKHTLQSVIHTPINVGDDDLKIRDQPALCIGGAAVCPPFTALNEEPTYVVREYAAALWLGTLAQARAPPNAVVASAALEGVPRLRAYFAGENSERRALNVTTVVAMRAGLEVGTQDVFVPTTQVSMYIPDSDEIEFAPQPTEPSLYFYEESAYTAYARPVAAMLSDQDLALQVLDFARQLRRDNVLFNDGFFVYQIYDSPAPALVSDIPVDSHSSQNPHQYAEIIFRDVNYLDL